LRRLRGLRDPARDSPVRQVLMQPWYSPPPTHSVAQPLNFFCCEVSGPRRFRRFARAIVFSFSDYFF
jgi:hypothetical protein